MDIQNTLEQISNSKRIVIKVGTSTLTHGAGMINIRRIENLTKVICDLKNSGKDIVLVSSGAIGVGVGKMGLKEKPKSTRHKQAIAAVGQCELMYLYDKMFSEYSITIAQILLTKDVVTDPIKKQNAQNTFETLFEMDVIPIVNENDSISTDEIECGDNDASSFGDNDTLSAIVSVLSGADLLIIMSDIDGVFEEDPNVNQNAKLIPIIDEITDEIKKCAGGAGTNRGTGGMITKFIAANIATSAGIHTMIINGKNPHALYDICEGKQVGTLFLANKQQGEQK